MEHLILVLNEYMQTYQYPVNDARKNLKITGIWDLTCCLKSVCSFSELVKMWRVEANNKTIANYETIQLPPKMQNAV